MDLSFIDPPNWKKESQLSPIFLGGVVLVAAVVTVGIFYFSLSAALQNNLNEISDYKRLTSRIAAKSQQLTAEQKLIKSFDSNVLHNLRLRTTNKQLISNKVSALYQLIPDNVVLSSVSIELKPIFSKSKDKSKKKVDPNSPPALGCEILVKGLAVATDAEDPDETVRNLTRKLKASSEQFGTRVVSAEINGDYSAAYSSERKRLESTFAILVKFKSTEPGVVK